MLGRVIPFAERNGLGHIFKDFPGEQVTWIKNLRWIIKKSLSGETVVDIGPGTEGFNIWYGMEWLITRILMKP